MFFGFFRVDMIILLGIILVSTVECRTFIRDLSQTQVYVPSNRNFIIEGNSMDDNSNEEYDTYLDLRNKADSNELDFLSQEEQIFADKWNAGRRFGNEKDRELIQTYILVKRVRQRNKRYVSYLTLCHFKICNIGKKRTTRYLNAMKTTGSN